MMFTAGWGREALLLELAYDVEEARPFARIQGWAEHPAGRFLLSREAVYSSRSLPL